MKTILILGGGVMQLPAMRIARRKGWRVVAAAREVGAEARALAHRVLLADLGDPAEVIEQARRVRREMGLDGVFTAGTDFSTTVSAVAEALGLPGLPLEVARGATDKVRMRDLFLRHGVPSPRFLPLGSVAECASVPAILPFPLVVKPADNMGARGVRRVDAMDELERAVEAALAASRSGRALVEEYLEGPELSIDAIVYRRRICLCGVADRHIRFPPFFVEMGHTMPTGLEPAAVRRAVDVFKRGVRALGIREGAAKGDVKVTSRGPFIGEIAARLSGGYMSGWTYPLSSGVEPTAAALNIAAGLPPGALRPARGWIAAERAFISIPGVVARIEGAGEIRRVADGEGVREVFFRAAPGDRVAFPVNNLQKCGNIIAASPSRQQAIRAAEEAARTIFLRLAPDVEETTRWLLSGRPDHPCAFRLTRPDNLECLRRMPFWRGELASTVLRPGELAVAPLPDPQGEPGRDWHGMRLEEAWRGVERYTGLRLGGEGPGRRILLGRLFWRTLLNGGLQGGVYLIDSLLAAADAREFLAKAEEAARRAGRRSPTGGMPECGWKASPAYSRSHASASRPEVGRWREAAR